MSERLASIGIMWEKYKAPLKLPEYQISMVSKGLRGSLNFFYRLRSLAIFLGILCNIKCTLMQSWIHHIGEYTKPIISQKLRIAQILIIVMQKIIVGSIPIFPINLATFEQNKIICSRKGSSFKLKLFHNSKIGKIWNRIFHSIQHIHRLLCKDGTSEGGGVNISWVGKQPALASERLPSQTADVIFSSLDAT